ncbi:hypothetical protein PRUPE_2G090100 [Prunus persica]|uniref:Uncharacterized protein n=1 Tax=Prunus persica TaxID=3760 RepID=A0A251QDG6_PRUPE|nr:hypothetical protein PRUPE_2G090100 [Prunus persica]
MAKGDDAVRKKQNKTNRKKLRKNDQSSSAVSARVASIIAAKKRRHSGKRRKCQGMCFSLPTLDDPFNDRNGAKTFERKTTKKEMLPRNHEKVFFNETSKETLRNSEKVDNPGQEKETVTSLKDKLKKSLTSINSTAQKSQIDPGRKKTQLNGNGGVYGHHGQVSENLDCPSKYLIQCLNSIENSLRCDGTYNNEEDKPLFVSTWGVEFWKCYSARKDILETSGTSSTIEQIAWMVSSAADSISRKDEEDLSVTSPFLLFLVPSQVKATQVRSVCRPLKVLGIHTVSIHPGASLDHQIEGLKSSEPEFMIATPERLSELLSLKAVDLSGVSLLAIQVLDQAYGGRLRPQASKVLYIVGKDNKHHKLVNALKFKGYSISPDSVFSEVGNSVESKGRARPAVSMIDIDQIGTTELGEYEVVIIPDMTLSIEGYVQILTRMARYTVNGVLHSLFTREDAELAGPLTKILEQCGQAVPDALRKMSFS